MPWESAAGSGSISITVLTALAGRFLNALVQAQQ